MPKTNKKVETFQVEIKTVDDSVYRFEDMLISQYVIERDFKIKGKYLSLKTLDETPSYIVALMITSKRHNIPPKTVGTTKKVVKLGLDDGDGLGYANVLLYEKKSRILMYETNKNGCYVDQFLSYMYKGLRHTESGFIDFELKLNPVFSFGGLDTVMGMTTYKSFEFEIANPAEMLLEYEHKNDAVGSAMNSAISMHSDKASIKFEVDIQGKAKHEHKSLANTPVGVLLKRLLGLRTTIKGKNVKRLKIVGYAQDNDTKLSPIDLITDRYITSITLNEPRENVDLLETQRKNEIIELYKKCKKDFDKMFKNK